MVQDDKLIESIGISQAWCDDMLVFYLFLSYIFQVVLEQNGLAPGGLNFDAKVRRESTAINDMFIAHIGVYYQFYNAQKIHLNTLYLSLSNLRFTTVCGKLLGDNLNCGKSKCIQIHTVNLRVCLKFRQLDTLNTVVEMLPLAVTFSLSCHGNFKI